MKYQILIISIILVLLSCDDSKKNTTTNLKMTTKVELPTSEMPLETFKTIADTTIEQLNVAIMTKNLKTETEIMNAYQPKSLEVEDNYTYTITQKEIDHNMKEVKLVEEGLLDDSLEGVKTIMTLKFEKNRFRILSIKQNYKCYENRGHRNWSAILCQ